MNIHILCDGGLIKGHTGPSEEPILSKQAVSLPWGEALWAQRITDQCDSSVIQISVIFFLLHFPVGSFLHRFEVHIAVAHTQLTHLHFEILFMHPEDLCVEHLEC